MISFKSKEQANLVLAILEAYDDHILDGVIDQINNDVADFKRKELPPITKDEQALLKSELLRYVTTGKPKDLIKNHNDDWFIVNKRNQVCWNFRNCEHPIHQVADKLGLLDRVIYCTVGNVLYNITQAVKRHPSVKAIKQRAI